MAIKIHQIELSVGIEPIRVENGYSDLLALIRYRGRPVGWIEIPVHDPLVSSDTLRKAIADQVGLALVPIVFGTHFRPQSPGETPAISVVVCTRDRAQQLADVLKALVCLDYPNYEILVVDNAPATNQTETLCRNFPVRYLREQRPGLDWARNCGIASATHRIVAFIDDDARPDRRWLQALAQAFSDPEVQIVTGPVLPAELETDAQVEFEFNYGGMNHGFKRRVVERAALSNAQLLWASSFGVGTNMAFRRGIFDSAGLFDVALDVGTASGGGGDIEYLHRAVASGATLVYEPSALVWHTHRRTFGSLRRQLYNNGTGFGCYLFACARNRTVPLHSLARFAVQDWLWDWLVKRLVRRGTMPRKLAVEELLGACASPWLYLKSRLQAQRLARAVQTVRLPAQPGKLRGQPAFVTIDPNQNVSQ